MHASEEHLNITKRKRNSIYITLMLKTV